MKFIGISIKKRSRICPILFWCLLVGNSFASSREVKANDMSIFLGTIGPLLAVQSGINLQLSYQYSPLWSVDVEAGTYQTNSTSPYLQTTYSSIGPSIFINELFF